MSASEAEFRRALALELARVGITGRVRARILDEFADHLACDPGADLGQPGMIARRFADEIGSARARTAAVAAFASLVVAGALFATAFLTAPGGLLRAAQHAGGPARAAGFVAVIATQLACACGGLAMLRWLRRRDTLVLSLAEATVIVRRAAMGVAAGVAAMAALGVIALSRGGGAWEAFAVSAAGVGVCSLLAALPSLSAAAGLRPVAEGGAGDLTDDLGPLALPALRGRPWRVALLLAAGVALAITLAAVPAADEFDGAARGLLDAVACLAGFATLGPYLGLWRPGSQAA